MAKKRAVKFCDFFRNALIAALNEERQRTAVRRYVEGYRRRPESPAEISFAMATAALAFDP